MRRKKPGMHTWLYDESDLRSSDIAGGTDTHRGPKLFACNDRQNEICNAMLSVHSDFDYGDERITPFTARRKVSSSSWAMWATQL